MRFIRVTLRSRMALLYGALMVLMAAATLVTSLILLDRAISGAPLFQIQGQVRITQADGTVSTVEPSQLGQSIRDNARSVLLRDGLVYLGVIVVVGAAGGYLMARQAFAPVARVTRTAQQLSTKTLKQRIDLGGPDDELRELADTFDNMLARLDAAFESQRMFVANASHELRTPLSVMRTELDVTLADDQADAEELRRMAAVLVDATMRAQHLVDSLLVLARLQAGDRAELDSREELDLAELVPPVVSSVRNEVASRQITLEVDAGTAETVGDPNLLGRVVGNLVENAVRYNTFGGWIRVATGSGPAADGGECAWLQVENTGPVVASEGLESLFEPFRRGGKVRTATRGAGLGLAIVRMTVGVHGGTITATPRVGGGLIVRVELRPTGPAVPSKLRSTGGKGDVRKFGSGDKRRTLRGRREIGRDDGEGGVETAHVVRTAGPSSSA